MTGRSRAALQAEIEALRSQLAERSAALAELEDRLEQGAAEFQAILADRKRAEEHLQAERRFLQQLLRSHERDRQLMAYDLHDGLIQDITGALLHLEGIEPAGATPKARGSFELAVSALRRAIADGRRFLSGLGPPILDQEGVVPAIEYLVAEQSRPGELEIEFTRQVSFERLEPLLEGTIYRIVQESLTNIRRHSQARSAHVRLEQHGERLMLSITDSGVGFDAGAQHKQHFGLDGIKKRAAVVGGQAEIISTPGQGTRVEVEIPVSLTAEAE